MPLILIALSPVVFFYALRAKFSPALPGPPVTAAIDDLEAQRQDIDYFAQLVALDKSFSDEARGEAERQIAELRALAEPLHPAHFRVQLTRITALADNARIPR